MFLSNVRFNDSDVMVANKNNIAVDIKSCIKYQCHRDCSHQRCNVCYPCVGQENRYQMREAVRENMYAQNNFRRLFPTEIYYNDEKLISRMTKNNQISINWFREKCEYDQRWC